MQKTKYPSTFHLPWSPGISRDDSVMTQAQFLLLMGQEVVVTEKMDGENTSLYRGTCHARSLDSRNHPSRDWVKKMVFEKLYMLPDDRRVCGENLYAQHTLRYDGLPSYFLAFSIWDEDVCLSWDETMGLLSELGLCCVPVLARGILDESMVEFLKGLWTPSKRSTYGEAMEGYVVRKTSSYRLEDFKTSIAKFVRKGHVQTDEHWMDQEIVKNGLST